MGRPSKYAAAFVAQAVKLCRLGATDIEIADFFEVDVRTLYRWKGQHEAFCQALKAGKEVSDERVERSLFSRAGSGVDRGISMGAAVTLALGAGSMVKTSSCIWWHGRTLPTSLQPSAPRAWASTSNCCCC